MKLMFLGEPGLDRTQSGKKALNLHDLIQQNFPVPAGFVISPQFDMTKISDSDLTAAIEKIGGFPVAVRSSGSFEDTDSASFAGQYASFLEVASLAELREKIEKCRVQALSDHLQTYSKERGLGEIQGKQLSVLIQKMVKASKAGVTFAIHPVTGREEETLHEVCQGLGERLVSGQVTPSQYVYHNEENRILSAQIGSDRAELSKTELQTITSSVWKSSAYFGKPQDIEWAIDNNGTFWFLQSRPITQIQFRTDVDEMTNADLKDGGVSARICTPLMFSLYQSAFDSSMQKYMQDIRLYPMNRSDHWMKAYYGRVYWNAALVKRCLFKVPGFNEKDFDDDLGIQKNYGSEGPHIVSAKNPLIIAKAIPVAIALEQNFDICLKNTDIFSSQYEDKFNYWNREISNLQQNADSSDETIFNKYILFIDEFFLWTEKTYFNTIYNNSNLQTVLKDFIRGLDKSTKGETQFGRLLGGLSDISHLELQKDFLKLYRSAEQNGFEDEKWTADFSEFMKKNHFHSDVELDISVPRWEEVPELILHRVKAVLTSKIRTTDPQASADHQMKEYQQELSALENRIRQNSFSVLAGMKITKLRKLVNKSRVYLRRREKMREYSTRAYCLVRKFTLLLAERFVKNQLIPAGDDIFQLQLGEIFQILEDQERAATFKPTLLRRKERYQGFRNFVAPNEFGQGIVPRSKAISRTSNKGEKIYTGLACSPGIIRAPIRVLKSIEQMNEIQEGDILVTQFTDPAWTPVLGMVKGIITEVGGLLSHAAIISREYGIPAVLNVSQATDLLKNVTQVELNGSTGEIIVLEERKN